MSKLRNGVSGDYIGSERINTANSWLEWVEDGNSDPHWEPKPITSDDHGRSITIGPVGWVCPVCGCGNSFYAMYCRCNAPPMKITY